MRYPFRAARTARRCCCLCWSKRYGVLFYPIVNKVEKTGTVEIMAKAKDAKQINRIFERMGYPAPVQSDARKQRPRAPSENSFKERGSGARTSTEMDKPRR